MFLKLYTIITIMSTKNHIRY